MVELAEFRIPKSIVDDIFQSKLQYRDLIIMMIMTMMMTVTVTKIFQNKLQGLLSKPQRYPCPPTTKV